MGVQPERALSLMRTADTAQTRAHNRSPVFAVMAMGKSNLSVLLNLRLRIFRLRVKYY